MPFDLNLPSAALCAVIGFPVGPCYRLDIWFGFVLTSKRRPHGEIVVVYSQQLLGFGHQRFRHVWTAFVDQAAKYKRRNDP